MPLIALGAPSGRSLATDVTSDVRVGWFPRVVAAGRVAVGDAPARSGRLISAVGAGGTAPSPPAGGRPPLPPPPPPVPIVPPAPAPPAAPGVGAGLLPDVVPGVVVAVPGVVTGVVEPGEDPIGTGVLPLVPPPGTGVREPVGSVVGDVVSVGVG